jgi:hypothetical protein
VDVRVIIIGDRIEQLILLPHTKDLLEDGRRFLLPYLDKNFWASLVTGYISAIWHQDNFMFITKPSKNPYSGPRDFRLISFTSFLLKTMDKMVDF